MTHHSGPACDVLIVGAGPGGCAAALAVLGSAPHLSVVMVDAAGFPRDKTCGDGIAPQVLDRLDELGVSGLVDDWRPVRHFDVRHRSTSARRSLPRPMWVVPRKVFDARLVGAATRAGAELVRHRVRRLEVDGDVLLDRRFRARVVIGADGAHSTVRAAAGIGAGVRRALAVRGYSPTPPCRQGVQAIVFSGRGQPSYAWSFDRGDGLANVGYGQLLDPRRAPPTRGSLLEELDRLLPGATGAGEQWRGHHLPLSTWRWRHPEGPLMLVGDAASLVNPVTGEGIYYAVTSGMVAGATAVRALEAGAPHAVGHLYRRSLLATLSGNLRHTAVAAKVFERPSLIDAGVRAAGEDQRVFDDFMEIALGQGKITPAVARGVAGALWMRARPWPADRWSLASPGPLRG